ncbi:hypothetical protein HF086_012889 [Spodoptera exigua]|uniref:Uncharacterized protein n=1 Tax=Spodoptera exigua TaxID=7107 RepID=A0A922MUT2_SPOEX|nr:hypothetical protein HF086_012889 [Spodoptera exigua]
MVDAWYVQSMLYKGNVTYYVPPRKDGKYYGDFAQTLWAKSYMVGCARSRYMTHWHGRLQSVERLVCNIAPYGPQATRPLWRPGAPTSSCPPRSMQSLVWLRLCDYKRKQNESISLDPSTTLEEYLLLNTVLEIEGNETLNYLGSLDEIYLTKLAIATMVNMFTTQGYFDSMQKKEIVEFVDVIEIHVNDSTIAFVPQVTTTENSRLVQNDLLTTANTTVSLQKEMTTKVTKTTQTKYARNRIKASGINDMEYFLDFIEMTEYIKAIEDKHKIKMDLHEGIETTKDNKMSYILLNDTEVRKPSEYIREAIQNVQICHNLVEGVCVDEIQSTTAVSEVPSTKDHNFTGRYEVNYINVDLEINGKRSKIRRVAVAPKQLLEDVTDERHLTSRRYFGLFDIQMYDLLDDQSFSGSGDENIVVPKANSTTSTTTMDPETVRELQEALDRIEHDLDPTSYKRKERRDLRDDTLNELEATSREYAETPSNESESVDHIVNILKRIPSWAKTTDERMNGASRVAPSLAIFLALRL